MPVDCVVSVTALLLLVAMQGLLVAGVPEVLCGVWWLQPQSDDWGCVPEGSGDIRKTTFYFILR